MIRKLIIGALAAAGLWLVAIGAQKWFVHREVSSIVQIFMKAMQDGDHLTVLSLLEPSQRTVMEARQLAKGSSAWKPIEGLEYRVHHLDIEGEQAAAQLLVEKDGFNIRPTLRMRRSSTSNWKITQIDDLEIDPSWIDLQVDRARARGEELANELADALKGNEGIEVERVVLRKDR